jgi:hypothetical protein
MVAVVFSLPRLQLALLLAYVLLSSFCLYGTSEPLNEKDRVEEYFKRGYSYPVKDFLPNTEGWKDLMTRRMNQITEMEGTGERYEAFYQVIHSATLAPNFTEYGFGLAKCPEELLKALQQGIYDGLESAELESMEGTIDGPNPPLFVRRPDLTRRVLNELHSYTEEWVGIPLVAHQAYGFRVYRNESQLYMHTDRIETHVVSFILHIDSSEDADPWPIFIEDFHGRTHEVTLTPGDILFYESSKCFHGRPRPFNGSWYTSVFVHYYPAEDWIDQPHDLNTHYAIPLEWGEEPPEEKKYDALEMVGTTMREPNCPNYWCNTVKETVKWSGPAEDGILILPDMERIPFLPGSSISDEL